MMELEFKAPSKIPKFAIYGVLWKKLSLESLEFINIICFQNWSEYGWLVEIGNTKATPFSISML